MQRAQHEADHEENSFLSSESQNHDRNHLRVPSRSPHPYHRRKPDQPLVLHPDTRDQDRDDESSPTPTRTTDTTDNTGIIQRRTNKKPSLTPSESGTEADDEGYGFIKALPAPPLRPRKGLRDGKATGFDGDVTPLLTPTKLDEEDRRFSFDRPVSKRLENDRTSTDEDIRAARAKFVKRRRAELHRRISEVLLLAFIGFLILCNESIRASLSSWHRGKDSLQRTADSNTQLQYSRAPNATLHHRHALPSISNTPGGVCLEKNNSRETHNKMHSRTICIRSSTAFIPDFSASSSGAVPYSSCTVPFASQPRPRSFSTSSTVDSRISRRPIWNASLVLICASPHSLRTH
jgi:hypothetical protein